MEQLIGKSGGRDDLEDQRVDGRIILKKMLQELCGRKWTGVIWLGKRIRDWHFARE
jgi:hypothetical protein